MQLTYLPGIEDGSAIRLTLTHNEFLHIIFALKIASKSKVLQAMPFEVSPDIADAMSHKLTEEAAAQQVPPPALDKERMATSSTAFLTGMVLMAEQASLNRKKPAHSAPCEDCGAEDPDDMCDDCSDASSNHSAG
jgi:hypothetical protein